MLAYRACVMVLLRRRAGHRAYLFSPSPLGHLSRACTGRPLLTRAPGRCVSLFGVWQDGVLLLCIVLPFLTPFPLLDSFLARAALHKGHEQSRL